MLTIFGDSRVFVGVVAYLKSEADLIGAKQPYKLLREKLFSQGYTTTHFLSKEKHGLVLVSILLGPNLSLGLANLTSPQMKSYIHLQAEPTPTSPKPLMKYIYDHFVSKECPFLAKSADEFNKKIL